MLFKNLFLFLSLVFVYNSFSLDCFTNCFKKRIVAESDSSDSSVEVVENQEESKENLENLLNFELIERNSFQGGVFHTSNCFKRVLVDIENDLSKILVIIARDHTKIAFIDFFKKLLDLPLFLENYNRKFFEQLRIKLAERNKSKEVITEFVRQNKIAAAKLLEDFKSGIVAKATAILQFYLQANPANKFLEVNEELTSTVDYLKTFFREDTNEYIIDCVIAFRVYFFMNLINGISKIYVIPDRELEDVDLDGK